tara:strand:+ start:563 stop:796 length:234 start_codon:yes stop_codon:yes gene_type:complete
MGKTTLEQLEAELFVAKQMSKLTKLEALQKAVVDTKAVAWYAVYAVYDDGDYDSTAFDAWSKARKNLSDYLNEQDNE